MKKYIFLCGLLVSIPMLTYAGCPVNSNGFPDCTVGTLVQDCQHVFNGQGMLLCRHRADRCQGGAWDAVTSSVYFCN